MKFYMLVVVAVAYLAYVHAYSCIQCNSKDTPTCATLPETMFAKGCQNTTNMNTTSRCYTRILDGNTIRGCESDLDNVTATRCNNEMECVLCSFMDGCNGGIFPKHRPTCIQCSANSTNSSCATNLYARPHVCPIYKLDDKCIIRNTGKNGTNNSFERGCLSTAQKNKKCVDERNCFVCEGAGCNNLKDDDVAIPLARDSATLFGFSFTLLTVGLVLATRVA